MIKELVNIQYRIRLFFLKLKVIVIIPHALKNIIVLFRYKKKHDNVAVVILCEHIGDIITCEPVSSYLKKERDKTVVWVVRRSYMSLLSLFENVDLVIDVDCLSECKMMTYFMRSFEVHNLHFNSRVCTKYHLKLYNNNQIYSMSNYLTNGSILETFSTTGNLPPLKKKPHLLLSTDDRFPDLRSKYVAIHLDANEMTRNWGVHNWERFLLSYPDISFIEIGITPHLSHISNCDTTYCGKLSLVDIAYLINKCTAFVGIESSVAHYANALGKPSLILMGKYRNFDYYVPYSRWDDNFHMIHFNGQVCELPLNCVVNNFEEKIMPFFRHNN
jgi:heptosyltransferase-3